MASSTRHAPSRFNVNRTVDGATPTRRAISLSPTPTVVKRSTSRTWRIVVLSAGIRSPVQKPKKRTLIGPAEAPSNRATSSRNGGRNHLGTPSEIKSECWATSSRIRGRLPPESAGERPRDVVERSRRPRYLCEALMYWRNSPDGKAEPRRVAELHPVYEGRAFFW